MNKVLHNSKIQNHSFLAPRTDLDNVKRRIIIYWGLISSKNRFIYGLNEGRVLVGGGGVELPEPSPPTCPKFNTHKKVVVHFFIPMLLLPKTPPLTYPNMKRFKGPKTHSLHFTFTSLS